MRAWQNENMSHKNEWGVMVASDLTGALTESLAGELIIPGFVSKRPDGVFIDLPRLHANGGFELFVNRLFESGARFFGLDYDVFLKLLYDADWLAEQQTKSAELKIAAEIAPFLPSHQALYKAVKVIEGGKRAEYVFEPVSMEVGYEDPIYGEPGEDGVASIVRYEHKIRLQPTKLDFDEFVADMWMKGLKFGIDADAVRKVIASGESVRMMIAEHIEPTEGSDARILEVYGGLHRDNSPKIMLNGMADLRAFKNRFPSIAKGTRMLKKIPRKLGRPGYKVTGEVIEPKIPKDLDLYALASVGTNVEQAKDGEYIVAALDGFITLDAHLNTVSVTEKIETREGISARTTGDLSLAVDEFIEHGEVQEGRVVEGKHMTFLSDVHGSVISLGGNICIEGYLSGGRAETFGANITLGGPVSRSVVRAPGGEVVAKYCECSTIIGRVARVEHAVHCEIIADEIFANTIEGCVVAAKKTTIASSNERKGRETFVTALIPDFSVSDQNMANLNKEITGIRAGIAAGMRETESIKSDQEFVKYLALHEKIKSSSIKLTEAQAANWQKLMMKNAKAANQLAKLNEELSVLDISLKESEEKLSCATRDRDTMGEDVACVIGNVLGQTTVQTMKSDNGAEIFNGMSRDGIRAILHKTDSGRVRIFSNDEGSVGWKFKEIKASY